MSNFDIEAYIKELPKTELHLHFEATISFATMWKIFQKNELQIKGIYDKRTLQESYRISSLDEFVNFFINVLQMSIQSYEDIELIGRDLRQYLLKNNIKYAEIFFSPSKLLLNGLDYAELQAVLDGIAERIFAEEHIEIKYLIDVSRNFGVDNSHKILDLLIANRSKHVLGIGLGGAESTGHARDFVSVFDKAHAHNLYAVAHAGEAVASYSIKDALNLLKVRRIGHGTALMQDEELLSRLVAQQTPVEICISSNIFTKHFVRVAKEHPVRLFYDKGLNIAISSDDPSFFSSELNNEFLILAKSLNFTPKEILQLLKNSIYSSAARDEKKEFLWGETLRVADNFNIYLD